MLGPCVASRAETCPGVQVSPTLEAPKFSVDGDGVACDTRMMFEAAITEFPFVDALPRREKSKLAHVWDLLQEMKAATKAEGQLVPVNLTCKLLDIGRTRVDELCAQGRLRRVKVADHVFITEDSIVELAREARKVGRPMSIPTTGKGAWKVARSYARK